MRPLSKLFAPALQLAGTLAIAACGDAPTGPDAARVRLARVDAFTPGEIARLTGRSLKGLRVLTVGGDTVTELTVLGDSVATFRVPVLRSCETDGREVVLVANDGDTLRAQLSVPGTITLAVGESRVLQAADLECLRLPARDEDFVLSAANTGIPMGDTEAPRQMLFFVTWTEADNRPEWTPVSDPQVAPAPAQEPAVQLSDAPYSDNPVPFDPRYATAQVGDDVTMVDWPWSVAAAEAVCRLPRAQVPTYTARVIAAAPHVLIAVDLRHARAGEYINGSNAWAAQTVQLVESLLFPTMRSLFDASFQPLRGGGGRYYVLLGAMSGFGFAWDGLWPGATGAPQANCAHASEMTTVRFNAEMMTSAGAQEPAGFAGLLIHEYAHNVDARTQARAGRASNSSWYLNEAWATLSEETAARIASQQPENARHGRLTAQLPTPNLAFHALWGRMERSGPWQFGGRYTAATTMLMFLRELAGEVSITHAPALHRQTYAVTRDWTDRPATVPQLAAAAGLTVEQLVDQYALASATAGLLPPEVIRARGLPHFRSWDLRDLAELEGPLEPDFNGRLSRRRNQAVDLWVADGGHAAVYLMGDEGRGVSLEFWDVQDPKRIVRLTRLR